MTRATVLVTGSSSGLGRATVETLARRGHTVFASMRDVGGRNAPVADSLRALARAEGLALEVVELDVTDGAAVEAAVQAAVAATGRIDAVVNNAAYGTVGVSEAITLEQAQRLFDVNLFGTLRVVQAALPHMRQQRSGLLIYVSSVAARIINPMLTMYCSTKAALEAMARGFAYDLREFGIETSIVQAGGFATDFGPHTVRNANQAVWDAYGATAEFTTAFAGAMNAGFDPAGLSTPQSFAEQIAELVAAPQGSRPLYVPIGVISELLPPINQAQDQAEQAMLPMFGMDFFSQPVALADPESAV